MEQRRGVRQFAALNAAQALVWPLQIATLAYLARTLGAQTFGLVTFAAAIAGTLGVLADLGLSTLGARDVAELAAQTGERTTGNQSARRYVRAVVVLRVLIALALWIAAGLGAAAIFGVTTTGTVVWAACGMIVAQALTCEWVVQGLSRLEYAGAARVLFQAVMLGLVWLTVGSAQNVVAATVARPIAQIAAAAFLMVVVWRLTGAQQAPAAAGAEKTYVVCRMSYSGETAERYTAPGQAALLRRAAPLAMAGLFSHAYSQRLDHVLLGAWYPAAAVGLYAAAYTCYLGLAAIVQSFVAIALPALTAAHARGGHALRASARALAGAGLALGLVLSACGVLAAPVAITWLFGRAFVPAVPLLRILSLAPPIVGVGAVLVQALVAADHRAQVAWCYGLGAGTCVALNLWLIPLYGATGAAATTLASELVVAASAFLFLRRVAAFAGAPAGIA